MTRSIIAAALVFAASVPAAAQDKAALAGNWTVDLRKSGRARVFEANGHCDRFRWSSDG